MSNFKRFAQNLGPNASGGMVPDSAGGWVLWCEAETAIRDTIKENSNAGDAYRVERKRTEQLLNELYHERARLEKVIEDAVCLLQNCVEFSEEDTWVDSDADAVGDSSLFGSIQQFIDTHGT